MNKHYRSLELDKILELLAAQAVCADTAQLARELRPCEHLGEVRRLLDETDAAVNLMARFGSPSIGGAVNIANALRRAQAGAMLSLGELLRVADTLRAIRSLAEWHQHCDGVETCLDERFSLLAPNKYLEEKIRTAVLSEEEISDHASSTLADIRRRMRAASARVRDQLDKLVHSPQTQKLLQDPVITIRGGRFVVPVKAEHRSEVPGLVHDTSASGATVFVEPLGAVEANNDLKLWESREAAEIERIVQELSAEAGSFAGSILQDYATLVELDLIFAKARLAYAMKATRPAIGDNGHICLHKARHPLIPADRVVPIDVELGAAFDTLVITGPNTGGKTVTLKTLGLLTLMVQCGLLPPVSDGSTFSVFRTVLADIGDEQSIEQSLSTFSAHTTNIIHILNKADEHSLVLLDELGAGTDPVEGAALAAATLEQLRHQGARIAATTHYAELKIYALQTPGVENGSCEFDVESLRPTYRLLVGVPGRSNAFAISDRLGMPPAVVQNARSLVSSDSQKLEDVVATLEEKRRELETQLASAHRAFGEAQSAKQAAELRLQELNTLREKELDEAREQAKRLVERARHDSEALLEELDKLRRQKESADFSQKASAARAQLRSRLNKLEDDIDPVTSRQQERYTLPRPLKVGDTVLLTDIDKPATVLSLPDASNRVEVQAGIIRTRVDLSTLRLTETKPVTASVSARKRHSGGGELSRSHRQARTELDLRGQTITEALQEVDKFLDDARLAGLERVTIIHGKGTGALRAAVQAHLRGYPGVDSFRLGVYGEGENGVTVVTMK